MINAPPPSDEAERLATLQSYDVLDTDAELAFDDLTALAATICGTPIALVSLIDANRQWFKSHRGLAATETPRELAFCAHAILDKHELFVVPDAEADRRFHDNPLTTGEPHVRFYAGAPLVTPSGHALGTLCVIDHVPRNLSDEQLQALQRLGRQVVSQFELRRARDAARKAAIAKADFLAAMSHEIRTPLNGVIGTAQLLSGSKLSAKDSEYVQVILRSGEHLLGVVNDILEFSRLESRCVQLETVEFDLQQLLAEVVSITSDAARRKGVLVSYECGSKPMPRRRGDPHRLRQTLLNLVGNAIKFTLAGSVTIRMVEIADGWTEFSVIDSGIGISPEAQAKLFSRFVQAESATARNYGGSGLGLAISREIVKLMGGEIGVQSQVGKGSRFWFRIPLAVADENSRAPAIDVEASAEHCDLGGRSVLVVEDDGINLIVIKGLLERCNCEVTTAENGADALKLCERRSFDLILMDGKMPEMDGYEASRRIRLLPEAWVKKVPIIALTADALEGDRERCLLAGMSDYASKPIGRRKLYAVLQRAITARIDKSDFLKIDFPRQSKP